MSSSAFAGLAHSLELMAAARSCGAISAVPMENMSSGRFRGTLIEGQRLMSSSAFAGLAHSLELVAAARSGCGAISIGRHQCRLLRWRERTLEGSDADPEILLPRRRVSVP